MSTRRQFLALSSAAVAASALPARMLGQFPTEVFSNANLGAYQQGLLTLATFQKHVGSVFKVFLPDRTVEHLTLLAVLDATPGTASQASAPSRVSSMSVQRSNLRRLPMATSATSAFDLQFAVSGPALAQACYTLDHGILGRFAAFLVPGVSAAGAPTCGASFNYLTNAAPVPGPSSSLSS